MFLPFDPVELPAFHKVAIIFINFVVVVLLLTVFNHNKYKDRTSQIFVLMGVMMLTWVDFAYLARVAGENSLHWAEIFLRIAWVATPLLFYFTYLTSISIMKKSENLKIWSVLLFILALSLGLLSAFSDLIISGIGFVGTDVDIIYGKGFFPFLGAIIVFIAFTLYPVFVGKNSKGARVFLVGVLIFYFLNAVFNIALPVFANVTHLYYFGDYSTVFLLGFTGYAIVRHELFDIRTFAAELLTITIWSILFSRVFVANNSSDLAIDLFVFALAVIFGILLIKSVRKEVLLRRELQELNKKLEELDARKDEFIGVAAHELRAPMTAIRGYLSMIVEGDSGEIPTKTAEFLLQAVGANNRLIRLVNNMLNVSRIEEGRLVFNMGYVNLGLVAKETFEEYRQSAKEKGLSYELAIQPGLHDLVFVDKDRIHEVLSNLVSNAIKYTDHGGVAVKVGNPRSNVARFEVTDTGPGVSAEEQSKLFGKFYRAESNIGKILGTGLGLYVSKLLIEKFSGKIGLRSEKGKGSTFWFELPVSKGQ